MARIGETERQRDRTEFVLGLHEDAAVLRQFAPQDFHDRRPGRDRIAGAVTHASGDQSVGERLVAVHRDLRSSGRGFQTRLEAVKSRKDVADGIGIAGLECHERGVGDISGFSAKSLGDQLLELLDVEVKDLRDQPEDENVLAFVLRRSAKRFDGQPGDRNADVNEPFLVRIRLDVVGIVEQDAAVSQEADVVLVAVLVKRDEEVRFVARGKNLARPHADLENRRTARNRGGDRHVGHDVLSAATGQAREESAGALDAVLRIAGEPDDGVADTLRPQISPKTSNVGGCVLQNRQKTHDKKVKLTTVR